MQRIALYCLLAGLAFSPPLVFADGHHASKNTSHCSSCNHCPRCKTRCRAEVTTEDVKKHCFEVECKTICIPKVTFPWQLHKLHGKNCCKDGAVCPPPAKCAKTRTVRVLVKYEYTCPKCKYTWTPYRNCSQGNCSGRSDTATQVEADTTPVIAPPPPVPSESQANLPLLPPLSRR
ncbi:MAG: hypothetical protein CL681_11995 [Blastopirellula sp.]|nr:hypothetical protein [Blastopirellula sp.]